MATQVAVPFEIEVLHAFAGDKKKKLDTPQEQAQFIKKMLREGTAIFLERGKKTYRVTDFDEKKNRLIVRIDDGRRVAAKPEKGRKTAVPPRAGG
jgi:hypothetical protein